MPHCSKQLPYSMLPCNYNCIPTLCHSTVQGPTAFHSPVSKPSATIPPTIDQYLAHLAAINDSTSHSTPRGNKQYTNNANSPLSMPVPCSPASSEPSATSCSQTSFSSDPDDSGNTCIQSTTSDRKLWPHILISYNETLLK